MELPERLKSIRTQLDKTQDEMAEMFELSRQTYWSYENGTRKPKYDTVLRMANVLGITPSDLIGWDQQQIDAIAEMQQDVREHDDEKESMVILGGVIRRLREGRMRTLTEVAEEFNMDVNTLVAYENGTQNIPQYVMEEFAKYYGVDLENVIALEMESSRNHTVVTTNKILGSRFMRWKREIGYNQLTDEEIDEIIEFTKYLIYKRKDRNK